jgi:hypothetical protein
MWGCFGAFIISILFLNFVQDFFSNDPNLHIFLYTIAGLIILFFIAGIILTYVTLFRATE